MAVEVAMGAWHRDAATADTVAGRKTGAVAERRPRVGEAAGAAICTTGVSGNRDDVEQVGRHVEVSNEEATPERIR